MPPNAPTWTAVAVIVLGLLLIFFAWNGAADPDPAAVEAQFPYLISGGLSGLALIAAGLVLVRTAEARKDNDRLLRRLDDIVLLLRELLAERESSLAAGEIAGVDAVVAGASSYHDPSCQLVADRDDLPRVSLAAAQRRGLAPCRICQPVEVLAAS